MCYKCIEIDAKIERFRRIAARFDDDALSQGLEAAIIELLAEKSLLHPEQQE
ncbi:hypothetical protein ACFPFP_00030 [Bradyrhizobium sp. GCM10023182]|uniref:Uncharacterized protein n=1 Tax=Bradyrhizobium zhengyangense TaxID=2911009 RepID=A0ABS9LEW3_9BRAD|nr:hypothetical protein [Bradyrhizobium zhengyangense]MCG2665314.1 hypothetical protein [Bradyrhizobium zhengyangense]